MAILIKGMVMPKSCEVARIEYGMMWVDNSSGEYAELGFNINFCPMCGARMEESE